MIVEPILRAAPWFFLVTGAFSGLCCLVLVWTETVPFTQAGWFVSFGGAIALSLSQSLINDLIAQMRDATELYARAADALAKADRELAELRRSR